MSGRFKPVNHCRPLNRPLRVSEREDLAGVLNPLIHPPSGYVRQFMPGTRLPDYVTSHTESNSEFWRLTQVFCLINVIGKCYETPIFGFSAGIDYY